MQRQDTVTMDGDEFDDIHTKIWLITDLIDDAKTSYMYSPGDETEQLLNGIRQTATEALRIMDKEDDYLWAL